MAPFRISTGLLGRDVDDRVYDLLRHIRYPFGPARGGLSGKSRPSDGGGDENSQTGTADGALQAEKGLRPWASNLLG